MDRNLHDLTSEYLRGEISHAEYRAAVIKLKTPVKPERPRVPSCVVRESPEDMEMNR